MKKLLRTSALPLLIPRLVAGSIFLSEGLQKFVRPNEVGAGRFAKIGFSNPDFWAYFTGSFEIVCGSLILIGFLTRLASIPLLIIMVVAFITTKLPILADKGFWPFAHEYRVDFAVTLLLILLLKYGAGENSSDFKIFR
jgi:putative oxidoreductase